MYFFNTIILSWRIKITNGICTLQYILPASLHPDKIYIVCREGMLQNVQDIIPTRENKNFGFWSCGFDPQNSFCDSFNLQHA